jgi:hypothetical protein
MIADGEGLYVVTGKTDRDFLQHARDSGLRVWDRDAVALQIGRAVLADIEGSNGELDLLGDPVKKTVSKADEVAKMAINAIFGGGGPVREEPVAQGSPLLARMSQRVERVPERAPITSPVVMEERQAAAPAIDADSILLNLRAVPLNVTKDHAVTIAKPHIHTYQNAVLKLVPFWQYNYNLKSEQKYRSKIVDITGEGSGCLNALNGQSENFVLHDVRQSIAIPDMPYELRQSSSTKEEARKNMLARIIDEHTKDLRFDNTQGDAIISEHKRFKPSLSDIQLDIDLVYIPIWEVKGPRNSIEVNAYTGEVLHNPVDDDAEFV